MRKGQENNSMQIWHERLAHLNMKDVERTLKYQDMTGSSNGVQCESCIKGKMHRLNFPISKSNARKTGELVHADLCGPMEETSIGNSRYFLLFKDDYTKYRKVYFLKNKSKVPEYFKKYKSSLENETGEKLQTLRTDNGLEFVNRRLKKETEKSGIRHERTVAYTPEQNGRAERENRTLVEAARSMLLAKKLWAETINTAAYVLNRVSKEKLKNKSPYELWYRKQASIEHLRTIGTEVFVHIPKQKRLKWDSKAIKGVHVGYGEETKGYRVWYTDQNKIDIQRDIIFEEEGKKYKEEKNINWKKKIEEISWVDTYTISYTEELMRS